MLKNNRGLLPQQIAALAIIITSTTAGLIQTANNGVLKKNGQTIWCKMQNKGNDYCDAKYQSDAVINVHE